MKPVVLFVRCLMIIFLVFSYRLFPAVAQEARQLPTAEEIRQRQQWREFNQHIAEQLKQSEQLPLEQQQAVRRKLMEQVRQEQLSRTQRTENMAKSNQPETFPDMPMPANLSPDEQEIWQLRKALMKEDFNQPQQLSKLPENQRIQLIQRWQQQRTQKIRQLRDKQEKLQAKQGLKEKGNNKTITPTVPPAPQGWNEAEQQLWKEQWELRNEQRQIFDDVNNLPPEQRVQKLKQWQETKGQRLRDLQEWTKQTMELEQKQTPKQPEIKK